MTQEIDRRFQRGLKELRVGDARECRAEIMHALNITTLQSLRLYAKGKRKLDVVVAAKIEEIFNRYGVAHPWGAA